MNILKLFKKRRPEVIAGQNYERYEIVLGGSGGQGIISAGKLLAEASAIYENKQVLMTQNYGPEARGGACRTEVIISPVEIDYPKVICANVFLAMSQEAMNRYGKLLASDGLLIVDETFVKEVPVSIKNVFRASFSALAIKNLDTVITANIIALAALAAITKIVSKESLLAALLARFGAKNLVLNQKALDIGFELVKNSNFKWEGVTGEDSRISSKRNI